jgi:hypothetical protein
MDTFPAIITSHMDPPSIIDIRKAICKGLMDDEMWCVIASEDLGNVFSCDIYKCYKKGTPFFLQLL